MRKIVAMLLALGFIASPSFAAVDVPNNQHGEAINDSILAGADSCVIDNSTGTTALLCTTGAGVVLGVVNTSTTATDFLTFRDSATANTSSAKLMVVGATAVNSRVDGPLARFSNGLSVNASVAPPVATGHWTILYRKR